MSRARGYGGLSKLRKILQRLPNEITKGVKVEVKSGAQLVHFQMLADVPKKYGNLANTITFKLSGDRLTARVGFIGKRAYRYAFYAKFFEFGTVKMAAHPFVFPALEQHKNQILKNINFQIEKAIRKS